jgi:hypothetical protein
MTCKKVLLFQFAWFNIPLFPTKDSQQWTQKFSYDSLGRLSESKEYRGDNGTLSYKQTFEFDRFGNLYRKQANIKQPDSRIHCRIIRLKRLTSANRPTDLQPTQLTTKRAMSFRITNSAR